ncbi:MAG: HDIG domain-containing protein [Desulfobacterales bacterium]|nr:HDIG domain-containing protein [Desulfobacterales bacterium]
MRSGWAMAAGLTSALLALTLFPLLRAGPQHRLDPHPAPLLGPGPAAAQAAVHRGPGHLPALHERGLPGPGGRQRDRRLTRCCCRIGAYFHDIGKLARPEGFIENQIGGDNLHDRIDPYESIAIIHGHMLQGVRMAREARLPAVVIDLIEQHHGTQSVEFFRQKALKLGSREAVREQDFRYPGPKPRTVEAALLMIADAVEAASAP